MKFTIMTLVAGFTIAGFAAGSVVAGEVEPANVAFDEDGAVAVSLSGVAGDPVMGQKIYASKKMGNCVACHEVASLPDVAFPGNVGPQLDGAGDRYSADQMRGILSNSKNTFEGTIMPAYYKVDGFVRPGNGYTGKAAEGPLDPLLSAQQIEDVIAFLLTLKE